ncbi:MAG: hypothetical protein K2X39_06495 [Silvanigrellaceae bacterium]|nr:hypothetical protein [Silvanigrellaceae bacterium]
MNLNAEEHKLSDFSTVLHLFLELRNKGISLSAIDIEVVEKWQNLGLEPEFIVTTMLSIAQEYKEKGKLFPSTLSAVDHFIQTLLRHGERF